MRITDEFESFCIDFTHARVSQEFALMLSTRPFRKRLVDALS